MEISLLIFYEKRQPLMNRMPAEIKVRIVGKSVLFDRDVPFWYT